MREIKVRMWNELSGKWVDGGDPFTIRDLLDEHIRWKESLVFVEYTGLHDKNGEIYEGDIWRGLIDGEENTWAVAWEEDRDLAGWSITPGDAEQGEVIGNIYENPELLEDT